MPSAEVEAAGSVQGVLLAPDGAPLRGSVTALVRGRQVGRATTGPEGDFRCSTGGGVPSVLVLAAPGHHPQARQVLAAVGQAWALGPVVLEPVAPAAASTSVDAERLGRRRRQLSPQRLLVGLAALAVGAAAAGVVGYDARDHGRASAQQPGLPERGAVAGTPAPGLTPSTPGPTPSVPSATPTSAAPRPQPAPPGQPPATVRTGAASDLLVGAAGWAGRLGSVGFADDRVGLVRGRSASLVWVPSVRERWQDYRAQVYVSALSSGATAGLVLAPGSGGEVDVLVSRGGAVVCRTGATGPATLGRTALPTADGHSLAVAVRPGGLVVTLDGHAHLALRLPAGLEPGLGVQLVRGASSGPLLDQLLVQRAAATGPA